MNPYNTNNGNDDISYRSKGKSALDHLHENISKEKEKNINFKISDIYGVDSDEANEIHVNYHTLRINNLIKKSPILSERSSVIDKIVDLPNLSSKVVSGEISESTCIDILIRTIKSQKDFNTDRYINFYN
ncbi:MAG: hypothetical protein M3162_09415 [Thermoproteota archaeon]|nr:hypothetical protein [Thermoproteota archaeon]